MKHNIGNKNRINGVSAARLTEHGIAEHVSSYDGDHRNGFHGHLSFDRDVDFGMVKDIFDAYDMHSKNDPVINEVISSKARASILATLAGYFNELEECKEIEHEYRQEKLIQLEKAKVRAWLGEDEQKDNNKINSSTFFSTKKISTPVVSTPVLTRPAPPTKNNSEEQGGFYKLLAEQMRQRDKKRLINSSGSNLEKKGAGLNI